MELLASVQHRSCSDAGGGKDGAKCAKLLPGSQLSRYRVSRNYSRNVGIWYAVRRYYLRSMDNCKLRLLERIA